MKNPDIEFEVVGFAEIDKYAKKAYRSMYDSMRLTLEISNHLQGKMVMISKVVS